MELPRHMKFRGDLGVCVGLYIGRQGVCVLLRTWDRAWREYCRAEQAVFLLAGRKTPHALSRVPFGSAFGGAPMERTLRKKVSIRV